MLRDDSGKWATEWQMLNLQYFACLCVFDGFVNFWECFFVWKAYQTLSSRQNFPTGLLAKAGWPVGRRVKCATWICERRAWFSNSTHLEWIVCLFIFSQMLSELFCPSEHFCSFTTIEISSLPWYCDVISDYQMTSITWKRTYNITASEMGLNIIRRPWQVDSIIRRRNEAKNKRFGKGVQTKHFSNSVLFPISVFVWT